MKLLGKILLSILLFPFVYLFAVLFYVPVCVVDFFCYMFGKEEIL